MTAKPSHESLIVHKRKLCIQAPSNHGYLSSRFKPQVSKIMLHIMNGLQIVGRISGPTVSAIIMFIECNMIILNEYVLAPAWILQARAYLRCACCLATISGLVSESWCSCAGPWRQHFGLCQYCDHFSPCTLQVWLLIFVQQHELQQFYPECSSCLHLIIPGESIFVNYFWELWE